MPIFVLISRHSPENCPMFNEKAKKTFLDAASKYPELMKKHGAKMVGGWIVPTEHVIYYVVDAPSLDAFNNLGWEPEIAAMTAFDTTEIKMAVTLEEGLESLK